jgi:mono-ADP-ribosyltransferase sirtuin 6
MAGSLGYAERLSWRDDLGGQLGDPELGEAAPDLTTKIDHLAQLIRGAPLEPTGDGTLEP